MESNDILRLLDSGFSERVEEFIDLSAHDVALKTGDKDFSVALKYLQKARTKMPSWYAARAIITKELFEQSTSEAVARAKFEGYGGGESVLDLTCGMGVDSAVLSAHFASVTSLEIDPVKAQLAQHNFSALSLANIEVVNSSAESFCAEAMAAGSRYDMIYVDPSRIRGENSERVFSLEDSSPNILAMLDDLLTLTGRLVVKLSPLFDIEELYRVFADYGLSITVISKDNECRELLAEVTVNEGVAQSDEARNPVCLIVVGGSEQSVRRYSLSPNFDNHRHSHNHDQSFTPRYLYRPDVAFYKSRLVCEYFTSLLQAHQTQSTGEFIYDSYLFTHDEVSQGFEGQSFSIDLMMPYNPKTLRAELKRRGIKSAEISLKNFPLTLSAIRTKLKLAAGNDARLFFTTYCAKPTVFFVT